MLDPSEGDYMADGSDHQGWDEDDCRCSMDNMNPIALIGVRGKMIHKCERCEGFVTQEQVSAQNRWMGVSGYDEERTDDYDYV